MSEESEIIAKLTAAINKLNIVIAELKVELAHIKDDGCKTGREGVEAVHERIDVDRRGITIVAGISTACGTMIGAGFTALGIYLAS